MKKILSAIFCFFAFVIVLTGCTFSGDGSGSGTGNNGKNEFALNEKFVFNDLEITVGSNYSFVRVQNQFSEYYGKNAVKMPVTVKNLDDDPKTLSFLDYDVYGPNGTKINTLSSYFDDGIDEAGNLLKDASYTKYFYYFYDGDGNYQIVFDDWFNKYNVKFSINDGPGVQETKTEFALNEKFEFDGLEVIAKSYTFTTVTNQFSEHYGKDVVRLLFSVKNLMDEPNTLSWLDLKYYGPNGTEVDSVETYFDDSIWNAQNLQKNVSGDVAVYFIYDGNGEYSITFGTFTTVLTLKIIVQK